mgnify:CR=1 FL=1
MTRRGLIFSGVGGVVTLFFLPVKKLWGQFWELRERADEKRIEAIKKGGGVAVGGLNSTYLTIEKLWPKLAEQWGYDTSEVMAGGISQWERTDGTMYHVYALSTPIVGMRELQRFLMIGVEKL